MNPASLSTMLALLQESPEGTRDRSFYQQYSVLLLVLILLGVIVITGLAFIVAQRRARRRRDALPKPRDIPYTDAWAEAGRRLDGEFFEINDKHNRKHEGN